MVEKNISRQRPSWRVDDAAVNTRCDSALVMSDHSIFPIGNAKEEFCISVEIKPKCGFLPVSSFVAEDNYVKRSTSRFKMHQTLKLNQRKISQISEYDPLDLFSGSLERVQKALKALLITPQNNFRVFLNGSLIFGGMDDSTDHNNFLADQAFEEALKCVIKAEKGNRISVFLHLVSDAILMSGLLDRLLEAQKLDIFDIEGAIHAYYDVMGQPCMVCKELGEAKKLSRYTSLHSISLDESLKIVREYLISATAKDLSMMIGFKPSQNRDLGSPFNSVRLESTNQIFSYKVSFIDLDMKPLKKMPFYYELDRKIVNHYNRTIKISRPLGTSLIIEENSHRDQTRILEDASLETAAIQA
jgi:inositol-pentakisphosphate 2-kinase